MSCSTSSILSLSRRMTQLAVSSSSLSSRCIATAHQVVPSVTGRNLLTATRAWSGSSLSSASSLKQQQHQQSNRMVPGMPGTNTLLLPIQQDLQVRGMAGSKKKKGNKKNKGSGKAKVAKGETDESSSPLELTNTQHEEWVKFQRNISVEGFETGQTTLVTKAARTGTKTRGGKRVRLQADKELALSQQSSGRMANLGGGQFPPMRYSDEETERLLALAYGGIPARAGPRRSRHLKRMRIRAWTTRKIKAKEKAFKIQAHFRRMAKISRLAKEVKEIKASAPEVIAKDNAYQQVVLQSYLANFSSTNKEIEA